VLRSEFVLLAAVASVVWLALVAFIVALCAGAAEGDRALRGHARGAVRRRPRRLAAARRIA
jgi:hypothetical protein